MVKLSSLQKGITIKFGNKNWILLNPASGYVILNNYYSWGYFDSSGMVEFSPDSEYNVAKVLNTNFYNSFSAVEKNLILMKSWGIGGVDRVEGGAYSGGQPSLTIQQMKVKEDAVKVSAKIGLLSLSEWYAYSTQYSHINGGGGVLGGGRNNTPAIGYFLTPALGAQFQVFGTDSGFTNAINVHTDMNGRITPTLYLNPNAEVVNGTVVTNTNPTITFNTSNNQTLYENSTFIVNGSTIDTDSGDAVTVKYQINSGAVRNLHSAVSNGSTPINFSKSLTYKEGVLKDGNTVLTSALAQGTPHTISVWAEDNNGAKSAVQSRTFYVVPNRPPTLDIDSIASQSELINSNTITISGAVGDADNNDVAVTFQINDNEAQELYSGKPGAWQFSIALKDLRVGANTVTIRAKDTYDAVISKVLTINKTHNAQPVNKAVALYKITPPSGSAQKVLLWIERQLGDLALTAEISMTNEGEQENFVPLPRTNTGPKDGLQEDEFAYQADAAKTNIVLKIIYTRTDAAAVAAIKRISGVLS